MTTFTRISLNPQRRHAAKLLSDPQSMHAAVRASFPPDIDQTDARVLWRVDKSEHESVLYIVGPEKPTASLIVEQAGWDTRPAQTTEYERFLGSLRKGQRWRFELVANPTYSVYEEGKRGKVKAHVSVHHQVEWLYKKAENAGFALPPRPSLGDGGADSSKGDPAGAGTRWDGFDPPVVLERWTDVFQRSAAGGRSKAPVRIAKARFAGTLEVVDSATLASTLTQGIGRGRAYGCGLLTLAPVR
ncbi:type I-E CRISPR-associated protein Cas6/Cse3/CasE [Corynebacterium aquatimens]|uniref:CRISPR system Cascade subunit CasE n=1 Tax=Corynebacterium aquatimens TaxID=1190508 RepID=A0A931E544_9CORY|nr:type I-E CRISPR-associated protein Cas6/Cse3/CasE [Corynebacterium aquatimens]MBG6123251.1 CRISPR system Cascade subunit CasE [Corynebacterium aquatimens]WJY66420.1 CRISPR-associated endoribonuclease Cse3 [Corynebacterium aquatimens]